MTVKKKNNILVTSISRKVPLIKAVREAAGRIDSLGCIYGADLDPFCIGRFFVDQFWAMPPIRQLTPEQFIKFCVSHEIDYVIPTRDGELEFFAANRDRFLSEGIHVMVSDLNCITTCQDKLIFPKTVEGMGFPVIPTSLAPSELTASRYVVKERYGAGSISAGVNLDLRQAISHAAALHDPVFQAYVEGKEYSVDLYLDLTKKAKGVVARLRERVIDGESQITVTVSHPTLEKMCLRLAEQIGFYGHVLFQVLIDKQEQFHIIECNTRFGGASTLSVAAGLDSFYWFFLESIGRGLENHLFRRSHKEKKLVRYAEDLII